jgi:FKBP-type peptidyl-prolyl cis-trans isomerase SlyD
MAAAIQDGKLVELIYRITDTKTGQILSTVDFPLGYVHGHNDILTPGVLAELKGKSAGDVIKVPIDSNTLFGARDESLVFTDRIENVPAEYRAIGTAITMQNEKGEAHRFIVTRIDDNTLTVDGNNPLCGRDVLFELEIQSVRDATEEEIEAGGPIEAAADIKHARTIQI